MRPGHRITTMLFTALNTLTRVVGVGVEKKITESPIR